MWALRRASIPLKIRGFGLRTARACCSKLEVSCGCIEDEAVVCRSPKADSGGGLHLLGFYLQTRDCSNIFSGRRGLSSQAGARSSGEEDDLEEGFSELETPDDTDAIQKSTAEEENENGLNSDSDISGDHDDIEDPVQNDLELSKIETGSSGKITSRTYSKQLKAFMDAIQKSTAKEENENGLNFDSDLSGDHDDSEDPVQNDLELSKIETGSSGKITSRTSSKLFNAITDAPGISVSTALNKYVEEGNDLRRSEIWLAMLNLRKHRMYGRALQLSEWLETNKRLEFVERDYASRLDLIAKVHGLQKAENYIQRIPESFRGEVIYRTLLANCVAGGNLKKSEEVFNKMKDKGFPITTFACNQLLLLYKRFDKKKIADVLLLMEKENVEHSVFSNRILMVTKGQSNDLTGMEEIVETMKSEGIEPDFSLLAILARFYVSGGLKEKAEAIVKEMEGNNKLNRPNMLLLPLYAELGKADQVAKIWNSCRSDPSLDECLAAIEAWGKLNEIEKAEAVFNKMSDTYKKLSSKHYNALLKLYANNKMLAKGKDLVKQMEESGCRMGPSTWDTVVRLLVEGGEIEKADSFLQREQQQTQWKPLFNSYMVIMDQYAKRGDIDNTEKIFHRMTQVGHQARISLFETLVKAYINAKAPAYGIRDRMKAVNVFPNNALAAQLIQVDATWLVEVSYNCKT